VTNETPRTLGNHWTSKRGLKGAVVVVVGAFKAPFQTVTQANWLYHPEYDTIKPYKWWGIKDDKQ
jgi:hypothetical protein